MTRLAGILDAYTRVQIGRKIARAGASLVAPKQQRGAYRITVPIVTNTIVSAESTAAAATTVTALMVPETSQIYVPVVRVDESTAIVSTPKRTSQSSGDAAATVEAACDGGRSGNNESGERESELPRLRTHEALSNHLKSPFAEPLFAEQRARANSLWSSSSASERVQILCENACYVMSLRNMDLYERACVCSALSLLFAMEDSDLLLVHKCNLVQFDAAQIARLLSVLGSFDALLDHKSVQMPWLSLANASEAHIEQSALWNSITTPAPAPRATAAAVVEAAPVVAPVLRAMSPAPSAPSISTQVEAPELARAPQNRALVFLEKRLAFIANTIGSLDGSGGLPGGDSDGGDESDGIRVSGDDDVDDIDGNADAAADAAIEGALLKLGNSIDDDDEDYDANEAEADDEAESEGSSLFATDEGDAIEQSAIPLHILEALEYLLPNIDMYTFAKLIYETLASQASETERPHVSAATAAPPSSILSTGVIAVGWLHIKKHILSAAASIFMHASETLHCASMPVSVAAIAAAAQTSASASTQAPAKSTKNGALMRTNGISGVHLRTVQELEKCEFTFLRLGLLAAEQSAQPSLAYLERRCLVCREPGVESNALFLPCHHIAACASCSAGIKTCPFCERAVTSVICGVLV